MLKRFTIGACAAVSLAVPRPAEGQSCTVDTVQAETVAAKLSADSPQETSHRARHGEILGFLSEVLYKANRYEEAEKAIRYSRELSWMNSKRTTTFWAALNFF